MSETEPQDAKSEVYRMDNMSEPVLRALAIDFVEGKIFTDRHISDQNNISIVFMVLVLMDFDKRTSFLHDCGMLYEYMSERAHCVCNGMPTFFSVRKLTVHDAKLLLHFAKEYETVKAKFTSDIPAERQIIL